MYSTMANKLIFWVTLTSDHWSMQQLPNLRRASMQPLTLGLIMRGIKPFELEMAIKPLWAPRLLFFCVNLLIINNDYKYI